jgi:hypothetical protein
MLSHRDLLAGIGRPSLFSIPTSRHRLESAAADAAELILANLVPDGEMSRHRVGLALPAGTRGEKQQWAAAPSAA